jgi:uncharacterized protein (TIGR03435 family)
MVAAAQIKHLGARANGIMAGQVLALAVLTTVIAAAQPSGPPLTFEVASVREAKPDPKAPACLCEPPGRVAYRAAPLKWIIERGFKLQDSQIKGPAWLDDAIFDVDAKLPEGASREDVPLMLRRLLQERFHLVSHVESRDASAFVLAVATGGTKLQPPPDAWDYNWRQDKTGIHIRQRSNMKEFASYLSTQLDGPVVDETRMDGVFAIKLDFAPNSLLIRPESRGDLAPALPNALLQQLGLKLESKKRQIETLVISQIDKAPTAN